jgi:hypothetical protein
MTHVEVHEIVNPRRTRFVLRLARLIRADVANGCSLRVIQGIAEDLVVRDIEHKQALRKVARPPADKRV